MLSITVSDLRFFSLGLFASTVGIPLLRRTMLSRRRRAGAPLVTLYQLASRATPESRTARRYLGGRSSQRVPPRPLRR
jgi:hypothetical protein